MALALDSMQNSGNFDNIYELQMFNILQFVNVEMADPLSKVNEDLDYCIHSTVTGWDLSQAMVAILSGYFEEVFLEANYNICDYTVGELVRIDDPIWNQIINLKEDSTEYKNIKFLLNELFAILSYDVDSNKIDFNFVDLLDESDSLDEDIDFSWDEDVTDYLCSLDFSKQKKVLDQLVTGNSFEYVFYYLEDFDVLTEVLIRLKKALKNGGVL